MDKNELKRIVEALVFASDGPMSIRQINEIIPEGDQADIEEALQSLNAELQDHAFFIKKVSGGYQFASRPEFSKWIHHLYDVKSRSRLSRAALETLAIIAFKQPISKVEISAIRGVNSEGVIKGLLERSLVTITGRDTGAGRSLLFCTTKEFLQYFSLNDIADLPKPKEIEELLAEGEGSRILTELSDESFLEKIGEPAHDQAAESPEKGPDASEKAIDENETQ